MNKEITFLVGFLFFLTIISATTIYSGETLTQDLGQVYDYYSIVGNSTPIEIEVSQEGTIAYITPDKYSHDQEFEIVFFNSEKEVITEYRSSGGGSTKWKTEYVDKIVNNTVTEYVDRYIETDSGQEEVSDEIDKEISPYIKWGLILVAVFVVFLILLYVWKYANEEVEKDSNKDERRLEDNE